MADSRTAERLPKYLAGGISPFGTQKSLSAIMGKSLEMEKSLEVISKPSFGPKIKAGVRFKPQL
ncbi:MAG: hypothetical protein P8X55_13230 [Desulfosarcinaceae bacterium]